MAYNAYGISTVTFGSPVIVGVITKTSNIDTTCNVNALIENETGSIIARRYDDVLSKVTFDGYINAGTGSIMIPGTPFVYSSSLYNGDFICEKFTVKFASKEYTQFSAEGVASEYLSVSGSFGPV